MADLPEILSAVVVGPNDKLVLVLPQDTDRETVHEMKRRLPEDLRDRVLLVAGAEGLAVLRDPKAEGSMVGQCGDTIQVIGESRLVCHLAYGHVGEHSNGGATWTNLASEANGESDRG